MNGRSCDLAYGSLSDHFADSISREIPRGYAGGIHRLDRNRVAASNFRSGFPGVRLRVLRGDRRRIIRLGR